MKKLLQIKQKHIEAGKKTTDLIKKIDANIRKRISFLLGRMYFTGIFIYENVLGLHQWLVP